jgi:cytoskeletal protein RodZ
MANDINETNQNNDEENFGLPDIEYKPLDQLESKPSELNQKFQTESESEQPEESDKSDQYKTPKYSEASHSYEEEDKSNAPAVIAVIIAIVILVGGVLVWKFVYQPRKEKEAKALMAKLEKEKKEKEERERLAREEEERKRREAEAANQKPSTGTIETLSARTGRYYVIVSSAVDGDLIMDNARKLSAKGVSSKIIPPFGKWKFYRLTVADFDSFAGAQANADASKADYGPATWVMKY